MTYKDAIEYAYGKTIWYLNKKKIDARREFFCLNPQHIDRKGSMRYDAKTYTCICADCGAKYTIFDLIGFDYGLRTEDDKRQRAFWLFDIKVDYKTSEIVNSPTVKSEYMTPASIGTVPEPAAVQAEALPQPEPQVTPAAEDNAEVRIAMTWEQFGRLSAAARGLNISPEEFVMRTLREKFGI
ncbi:MAG: hypothetical protein LBN97_04105 [Oscillospiraceae bacterium]|jgi:hypothetical protein|nr:hypothetical protein [Oscillospiraceae bacterium]